jgi:DNA-binding LytR/AlgR family response regulator
MIRSLIVDHEPLVRERLRTLLADHADVQIVGEAGDGPSALEAFAEKAPCRSSSSSRPTISSRSRPFGCARSTT